MGQKLSKIDITCIVAITIVVVAFPLWIGLIN